jgi:hypothetical protein
MVPTLLQQVRWGAMVTEPEARPDSGNEEKDMFLVGLDPGSASAHRGYKPDHEQMKIMMNILEAIYQKLLVAPLRKQEISAPTTNA